MKQLKAILILVVLLALAACATTQQTDVALTQACGAYGAAFKIALQRRQAGKLNPAQIQTVNNADKTVTPICTGQLPPNPQAATAEVSSELALLVALETKPKPKGVPPK